MKRISEIFPSCLVAGSCLLMSLNAIAAHQPVSVKAEVDSTVVVMGDLNHVRVTVDMPASSPAQLIDFPILTPG